MRSIRVLLLIFLQGMILTGNAQKYEISFEVVLHNKKIGTLHAVEEKIGNRFYRDIRTNTDTKIMVMAIHVESEIASWHENGTMIKGTAYRHANRGTEDIHALITRVGEKKYTCERNGGVTHIEKEISYSVVDFYFKEPLGVSEIFSTMYADFLKIRKIAPGQYRLVTPDQKDSYYTYKEGRLLKIEAETPLGKVVSSRL